jgi:hypothetical protein
LGFQSMLIGSPLIYQPRINANQRGSD